jgi:hypothetical protein
MANSPTQRRTIPSIDTQVSRFKDLMDKIVREEDRHTNELRLVRWIKRIVMTVTDVELDQECDVVYHHKLENPDFSLIDEFKKRGLQVSSDIEYNSCSVVVSDIVTRHGYVVKLPFHRPVNLSFYSARTLH